MFFIHGTRKAKIKKVTDHVGECTTCHSIGLEFEIYREYFHLFWIPIFPVGVKKSEVRCASCGAPNNFNPRARHVESVIRTPIYLYSGPLLCLLLIIMVVFGNMRTQKEKTLFVSRPEVGDVYMIRKDVNDSTYYYFLRVARIQGDTLIVYPNTVRYFDFAIRLNDEDHFVAQDLLYTRTQLKEMLEKGEINAVERDYGDEEGFNRIECSEVDSVRTDHD